MYRKTYTFIVIRDRGGKCVERRFSSGSEFFLHSLSRNECYEPFTNFWPYILKQPV